MSSVVIVDDQGVNRKVLASLAATLEPDVQVSTFGDPLQALSYVSEHTPDLLITDYQMPTMNGAEFIRRFRRVPYCWDVPAVVVTAYEDVAFRATALDAGANEFILSPLDHKEFRRQSRRLLAERHADAAGPTPVRVEVDQCDMFNVLLENLSASLVDKIDSLARITAELESLLAASAIPAVLVDETLRVRRFTASIANIYALGERDIGQPLDGVACRLDYPDLAGDFRRLGRTGVPVQRYLIGRATPDRYLLRIVANRDGRGNFLGALVTFTDVSGWQDG